MAVCAQKQTRFRNHTHCAAVKRKPQQHRSLQSPCLRVTLVVGMRYLNVLPSCTDVKSSPDVGTAVRVRIQSRPPLAGICTRWYVLGSIHMSSPRNRSSCASRSRLYGLTNSPSFVGLDRLNSEPPVGMAIAASGCSNCCSSLFPAPSVPAWLWDSACAFHRSVLSILRSSNRRAMARLCY